MLKFCFVGFLGLVGLAFFVLYLCCQSMVSDEGEEELDEN